MSVPETPRSLRRFSFRCGLDSPLSHCLSLCWFWSHVVVLGVGPQLVLAMVLHAFLCSVAALSRSSGEVRGKSQAGEQSLHDGCSLAVIVKLAFSDHDILFHQFITLVDSS
ncbi:hypothetical protein Taro_038719 [Colocasia esculenta]|uniref:Uncharacterized protein n=1 Tax=Colocasia esculenta TaxID=4460 RepID=A0A843W8U3_COLES|nr:hypothetical protein [Colocasia esculenta]